MKILMLGWELPPDNSGGLGVACYHMCKQLALQGVDLEFVLPYTAKRSPKFMRIHGATPVSAEKLFNFGGAYDSHCYTCKTDDCAHTAPSDLRAQQRTYTRFVESLVENNNYDAFHAHDWLTFEAGMRAKAITNKPLIAHVHATEFDRSGEHHGNPLVHDIEYNGLMMADRIIAVSNITKELIMREYNIPASKIEVVHNSIDPYDFTETLDAANTYTYLEKMKQQGYKVVISVGRLTVQKGLSYLLKAAQKVISRDPKVLFVLAGDGELKEELILQAATLGIAHNIVFTGFVRGKQWRDVYSIGDMFVMSSVSEPFGLTALEAAGHNNAVLLTKQSGVGEVLHNALRFDYWDTDKLADSILNVAEHAVLQTALTNNALHEFNRMTWATAATKCKQLYHGVARATV